MILKKISLILSFIYLFVSCANTEIDGVNLKELNKEESLTKEIELSNLNLSTEIRKAATSQELFDFSSNLDYTYFVGPGDKLSIKNTENNEEEILTVRPDGKINIKTIGLVNVIEKNLEEIEKIINEKVKKYFTNKSYAIEIVEYNNNKIYIWGDIGKPGVIRFDGRTTLVEIVSLAGGVKFNVKEPIQNSVEFKNKPLIVYCQVVRKGKTPIWIKLNSLILEGNLESNVSLLPGDIVYIYSK